ncbi:MAG: hypothetical protein AB1489_36460, partial [Acidobacteriota bacterium]
MIKLITQSIQAKMVLPIVIGTIVVVLISLAIMIKVRSRNVELVGLTSAQAVANQITTLRTFYTSEVVSRAKKAGMEINYNFAQKDNTLPLPATLVKTLGNEIQKNYPGSYIRLYSRYPFPHRAQTE